MEKAKRSTSMLSWTKADYISAQEEIPDILESDNIHTEGQLMSREDVECFIKDTCSTFSIIRQHDETKFLEMFDEYCADLDYLTKIKKVTTEEATGLKNKDIYTF